jgi:hypothetical protein
MKKTIIFTAAFALVLGFGIATKTVASDKGPAEMTLTTAAAKKPATFPHAKHQETLKCDECHHTMTADGKQGPYEAGKEAKCESCHDGKTVTNPKVANFMKAAHENCKGCHQANKKGPTKCDGCHKK